MLSGGLDRPARSSRARTGLLGRFVAVAGLAVCFLVSDALAAPGQELGPGSAPNPSRWDASSVASAFSLGGESALGYVPEDAWDVVHSDYGLSDIDPAAGLLVPDDVRHTLTDQYAIAEALNDDGLMASDTLRAAELARQQAEARLRAQAAGNGRGANVGSAVPYHDIFNRAGATYGLDPRMLAAVAKAESNFDPAVVNCTRLSRAGAGGLMQLMPAVATELGVDRCNPASAVDGAARLLQRHHAKYNDWTLSFAAYNAGPGAVDRAGRRVPQNAETPGYVTKVNRYWDSFRAEFPDGLGETRVESSPLGDICVQTVQGITVACQIAANTDALLSAASADGIDLGGWGYRSTQRQIELRTKNGCPDVWRASASACRVPTARPGQSLHERGLAIDFTVNGKSIGSRSSAAFRWMAANAASYGFHNLPSEPWHWSTTGG